jgi:hypothetical protein
LVILGDDDAADVFVPHDIHDRGCGSVGGNREYFRSEDILYTFLHDGPLENSSLVMKRAAVDRYRVGEMSFVFNAVRHRPVYL